MLLVNLAIIATLLLYGVFGYRRGFVTQSVELFGFVVSFLVALALYRPLGQLLAGGSGLPGGISGLIAFMVLWLGFELLVGFGWRFLKHKVPERIEASSANRIGGVVPAILKGVVLLVVMLLIVASAPLASATRDPILNATLSKPLVSLGTKFQQQFNNVFGDALRDTLAFKTIKTGSDDSIQLGFTTTKVKVCEADEGTMLNLVNDERRKQGLGSVRLDTDLRGVARAHSQDMLARGYFSHVNPDGADPFDRMEKAGIDYQVAGENLAFAPTIDIAHTGLMNSPGHRAIILKPEFSRLGIGCQDAGSRGRMFSQEFAG